MKRILFLSVVATIGVLVFIGCDKEETYYPEGYATLQNQIEHSGIAVEIIEADTFIFTDSTGYYDLGFLDDGEYTLNSVFPFYKNERQVININDGELKHRIKDINLEQVLEHTLFVYDSVSYLLDYALYVEIEAKNVSNEKIVIHYFGLPWTTAQAMTNDTIIGFIIWRLCVVGYDTLEPGESYWGCFSEKVYRYPFGAYEIVAVMLYFEFGQELVPIDNYVYGTRDHILLHRRLASKLPRKQIVVR